MHKSYEVTRSIHDMNRFALYSFLYFLGSEDQFMWTYMKPTSPERIQPTQNNEIMPKVKLTGTGKMPVMDMRSQSLKNSSQQQESHQQLQSQHPSVSGLPPKSPVYAAVNKAKKSPTKKGQQFPPAGALLPPHLHNYCNVSPLLGDVINKKPQLFSKVQPEQVFNCLNNVESQRKHLYENTKPLYVNSDYLPMGPESYEELPVKPFDPMDLSNKANNNNEPIGKFFIQEKARKPQRKIIFLYFR